MQYKLFDFQDEKVRLFSNLIHESLLKKNKLKASILESTTGSGKTIITSFIIKEILKKTDKIFVLWVSYLPKLNLQSKKKAEDIIGKNVKYLMLSKKNINKVNTDVNQIVAFFNPQKLSSNSKLLNEYQLPKAIERLKKSGYKFVIILDEAHMNLGQKKHINKQTIIRKIMKGQYNFLTKDNQVEDFNSEINLSPDFIFATTATTGKITKILDRVICKNYNIPENEVKNYIFLPAPL